MDQMLPEVQEREGEERGRSRRRRNWEEGGDGEGKENGIQTEENICNIQIEKKDILIILSSTLLLVMGMLEEGRSPRQLI